MLVETTRPDGTTARIVYSTTAPVDVYELEKLCDDVGMAEAAGEQVQAALENLCVASLHLEIAETGKSGGGGGGGGGGGMPGVSYADASTPEGTSRRLVGLARATSDHAFNATIWDVVVDTSSRGKGSGRRWWSRWFGPCWRETSGTSRCSPTTRWCPSTGRSGSCRIRRGSRGCSVPVSIVNRQSSYHMSREYRISPRGEISEKTNKRRAALPPLNHLSPFMTRSYLELNDSSPGRLLPAECPPHPSPPRRPRPRPRPPSCPRRLARDPRRAEPWRHRRSRASPAPSSRPYPCRR